MNIEKSIGPFSLIKTKNLGIAYGEYMLRQLIDIIDADMVFDVGGNIGQYGLQLRNKIGYRGPIRSFEPIPGVAKKIRKTARNDQHWTVRECAIDDERGRANFNIMAGDQFSSLMTPSRFFEGRFHGQHSVASVIDVEVITLGDAVNESPDFSRGLLKLDTQGNEMRILREGSEHLRKFPAVQIEVGFQSLYENSATYTAVIDAFEQWGYRLCALFPNNQGHFPHLLEMDALFLHWEYFPDLP